VSVIVIVWHASEIIWVLVMVPKAKIHRAAQRMEDRWSPLGWEVVSLYSGTSDRGPWRVMYLESDTLPVDKDVFCRFKKK
jgi:hypothetical protein